MKKLTLLTLILASTLFGSLSRAADGVYPKMIYGLFVCKIPDHGVREVTLNDKGLLNAGRFGLYYIHPDLAQVLMAGRFQRAYLHKGWVRDFEATEPSGSIAVSMAGYTLVSRKPKVRMAIETFKNRVVLEDCLLQ